MKMQLKPLSEQVIVITGASSGIGLTTARTAARNGARLVLASRNAPALEQLADELVAQGAHAIAVPADVGIYEDVENIARAAIDRFGGFDTWINNAGVSIYGKIEDVRLEDQRRLFDTNFWGVVHGCRAAVPQLRARGGAIINMGSEVSDIAIPLQGIYSASKHAVKGFTDALRLELEKEGAPISVTLIKPAAIDTLFVRHAMNYLEVEPKLPPPVYAPELVADATLFAAENPRRDIYVGGAARLAATGNYYAPRLMDRLLERFMFTQQKTAEPARDRRENALYQPGLALRERDGENGAVWETSLYTRAITGRRRRQRKERTATATLAATATL
jgi:short-subunit dehydrogenase